MKFVLLTIAIFSNPYAFASTPVDYRIELQANEARGLYSLLPESGDKERVIALEEGVVEIRCKSEKECIISLQANEEELKKSENGVELNLFQSEAAEEIYSALRSEEFDTWLGKAKIFTSSNETFRLYCSKSSIPSRQKHSCTIGLSIQSS